ncbi:MAG: citrate lyase subunit alpha, partial [Dethiosulfovibrio sp.]|nr:citrate lyase subunit alpha [Dethiosulfovibrio sp.]
ASGLWREGVSFQTGAGGASLATALYLREIMTDRGFRGSFAMGGITSQMVRFLEEGLVDNLYDVQCFDLDAVRSIGANRKHVEVSASLYASPGNKGPLVDDLDVVILGAAEIDLDFNVNVHTDSSGRIIGGSGGHSDTAAGAKLTVVVAPLVRARLPIVMDRVIAVSTPGSTVDLLVTERGMAVNPSRPELKEVLERAGLPVFSIRHLRDMALSMTGVPEEVRPQGRVVAEVEYRDGRIIDRIRSVE